MKKLKEVLFFVVTLIIFPLLAILIWGLKFQSNVFVDFGSYLRLLFDSDVVWRAYGQLFLFSVIAIVIFTIVRCSVKNESLNQSKLYLPINVALGSIVSFSIIFIQKMSSVELLDAETTLYNALNIAEPTACWTITPIGVILPLHAGVFSAFVFWLAELIWKRIKKV